MPSDKKTIGITKANGPILTELVSEGRFGLELDAAKFAMAFAIREGVPAGNTDGAETKWNVGSVDPDGSMRGLLEALYPETTEPYRLIEHLMNEGLQGLKKDEGRPIDVYDALFSEPVESG